MVPTPGRRPLQFIRRMKTKKPQSSGKVLPIIFLPTIGSSASRRPCAMPSTTP
jgi:hypothetical protein